MTPELYLSLMTMHGTLMVFFVLSVAPQNAFGHYILPMQIGAERMAFPLLGSLSFWLTAASFLILLAAFFVPGGAPFRDGPRIRRSALSARLPDQDKEAGKRFGSLVSPCSASHPRLAPSTSSRPCSNSRRAGLRLMQIPLTCWNWLVTAILSLLGFPVLLAAGILLLLDRTAGTNFFVPGGLVVNEQPVPHNGGSPLLWQHLFWFFGHPEVYIAILPGMGLVSEVISTFSRKAIFGRSMMIVATFAIGFLGHARLGTSYVHQRHESVLFDRILGADDDNRRAVGDQDVQLARDAVAAAASSSRRRCCSRWDSFRSSSQED